MVDMDVISNIQEIDQFGLWKTCVIEHGGIYSIKVIYNKKIDNPPYIFYSSNYKLLLKDLLDMMVNLIDKDPKSYLNTIIQYIETISKYIILRTINYGLPGTESVPLLEEYRNKIEAIMNFALPDKHIELRKNSIKIDGRVISLGNTVAISPTVLNVVLFAIKEALDEERELDDDFVQLLIISLISEIGLYL